MWLQPWNLKMLAPWKKSYDKSRQYIKKQRHYSANKGLHSQSYGFFSSHVWMWELDHKKGWAPKTQHLIPSLLLLSVTQWCTVLCDPMDCSSLCLPVPHYLPEFAQVHVHCISDAIHSSHPMVPSPPSALNLSHNQRLFQWFCLHQMTKIQKLQFQYQSFQWIFGVNFP